MARFVLVAFALVGITGCGLETVPTLAAPNVNYLDSLLVKDKTLSLYYKTDTASDLQGYQVYYKIYPGSTTDFSRLVADRDSVNLSPTVNQLINLGYFQMSAGATRTVTAGASSPSGISVSPLLISTSDQSLVTLDFSNWKTSLLSDPELHINGVLASVSAPFLYRSSLLFSGVLEESFITLKDNTVTKRNDMSGTSSQTDANGYVYEINVFVVAYGLSSTLQAVYSKPVPWGVIR